MRFTVLTGIFMLAPMLAWGKVSLWVERNPVVLGETFQLFIEAEDPKNGMKPDLTSLQGFEVLHSNSQSNTTIVNSTIRSSRRWVYTLMPQKTGRFRIPPISVGNEITKSFIIEVVASPQGKGGTTRWVWLEGELSKESIYPGEEVVYLVRIIRTVDAQSESLSQFAPQNADIEQYEHKTHTGLFKGQRVRVTELHYSIFPRQPGILNLPTLRYQADVPEPGKRDPFGAFGMLRTPGKRIFRILSPRSVEVKPLPSGHSGWWLPARALTLKSSWSPESPEFRVGEPVTWTLKLEADGVRPGQLPELNPRLTQGLRSYPERPQMKTIKNTDGIHAVSTQKMALIPSKPGVLVIPELRLRWWDVRRDAASETVIPEQHFTVLAALNESSPPASPVQPFPTAKLSSADDKSSLNSIETEEMPLHAWKTAALLFAILWALTLLSWGLVSKKQKRAEMSVGKDQAADKPNAVLREMRQACRENNYPLVRRGVLRWAALTWPENPPESMESLSVHAPGLKPFLSEMDAACYGGSPGSWDSTPLLDALRSFRVKKSSKVVSSALPELYP